MRVFGRSTHSLSGCRLEDLCVDACRFERVFHACFASVYAHNSPEHMTKAAAEGGGFVGRRVRAVVGAMVNLYLARFMGTVHPFLFSCSSTIHFTKVNWDHFSILFHHLLIRIEINIMLI